METPNETQLDNNQPIKEKKSKKGLYISLILIVIISICVGGYIYVNNKQNELPEEEAYDVVESVFSVSEYDDIPTNYKTFIYNFLDYNKYLDGTYFLTKIADRAKSVYAFGDFTSDDNDEDDLAVLFENNDYQSSMLVIFNHKGEGLFIKHYENELPVINSFKVGSKIFMNDTKLVPAPCDGLIVKTDYSKYAIVYDKKTKKFNSYYQYSAEELKEIENERTYYEEETDEPIDDTPEEVIISTNNTESSN